LPVLLTIPVSVKGGCLIYCRLYLNTRIHDE
jgi:hypothetical protein